MTATEHPAAAHKTASTKLAAACTNIRGWRHIPAVESRTKTLHRRPWFGLHARADEFAFYARHHADHFFEGCDVMTWPITVPYYTDAGQGMGHTNFYRLLAQV
jgi:hypothetical protein